MPVYEFTIPDEVAAWILETKNIKPQTYIQNHFVDKLIEEYEASVGEKKKVEAEAAAKEQAKEMKKQIKISEKAVNGKTK